MANALRVRYLGTNVGKIYFTDIDKRHQLGGAPEGGNYKGGQDQYIVWGETKVLQLTDDVLYSMTTGVLKYFSTAASSTSFTTCGAPLVLDEGSYTAANEVPRQDLGDTGTTRFSDTYMQNILDGKYSTGAAGTTGYYVGNAL
jgi:hypothetical protein